MHHGHTDQKACQFGSVYKKLRPAEAPLESVRRPTSELRSGSLECLLLSRIDRSASEILPGYYGPHWSLAVQFDAENKVKKVLPCAHGTQVRGGVSHPQSCLV